MNPGIYNRQIVIQSKLVSGQDATGAEIVTWSTFSTDWASAEPLRGQEFMEARRLQAQVNIRFRLRYRSGITPAMRVSYDGRLFEIVAVIHPLEAHRELQLMCSELIIEVASSGSSGSGTG